MHGDPLRLLYVYVSISYFTCILSLSISPTMHSILRVIVVGGVVVVVVVTVIVIVVIVVPYRMVAPVH